MDENSVLVLMEFSIVSQQAKMIGIDQFVSLPVRVRHQRGSSATVDPMPLVGTGANGIEEKFLVVAANQD
jgi:hypothetical protein